MKKDRINIDSIVIYQFIRHFISFFYIMILYLGPQMKKHFALMVLSFNTFIWNIVVWTLLHINPWILVPIHFKIRWMDKCSKFFIIHKPCAETNLRLFKKNFNSFRLFYLAIKAETPDYIWKIFFLSCLLFKMLYSNSINFKMLESFVFFL